MPKKLKLHLPRAAYQALYARWESPGLHKRVRDRLSMVLDAAKEHATARIAADHRVDVQDGTQIPQGLAGWRGGCAWAGRW